MSKLWIYVAGPYTLGDVCVNVRERALAGLRLRDAGFVPIIPLLSHFVHYLEPRPYEYWMEWDFDLLERCDALLRLPGESNGADWEVAAMELAGKPVFKSLDTVLLWAGMVPDEHPSR